MKKSERIELYEKYLANWDEIDELQEKHGYGRKEAMRYADFKYRRTYVRICEIDRPIEIKGSKTECKVRFFNGASITVRANYDELCIRLDDFENEQNVSYLWQGN